MQFPSEEQISEMKDGIDDVFESIATHDGKPVADFTHALVSMKQIASGLSILVGIAGKLSEDADNKEAAHMTMFIAENATRLFSMAVSRFHSATGESVDLKKALEWAQKIDGQMDRCVERSQKN
jgi:hypothetical protein